MEKDIFDLKNDKFFEALNELFGINKSRKWDDIAQNITVLKMKRTYRIFAELFPLKYDYYGELEKMKGKFSSIHYGTLKGSKIIDEVTRFSLYSDTIVVFHPLQNPAITNPQMDPGRNPRYWLPDFMEALYFYIVIQKWVKAGIVKLIINPYDYDLKIREKIDQEARKRVDSLDQEFMFEVSKREAIENIADSFVHGYENRSPEYIYNSLLALKQPRFSPENAREMTDAIIKQKDFKNPLYKKLGVPITGSMIAPSKGGGPLESIVLLSEKIDGHIYTPSEMNWEQIKQMGLNDFWLKANHLYSKIPLNFLNNVDTSFALELRKEDRLAGVRKQLKRIYTEINTVKPEDISESRLKDLSDSFIEEIKTAETEWQTIKREAEVNRKNWLMTSGVLLPTVMSNDISIFPVLVGAAGWFYKNEQTRLDKQKLQKVKNPISVFVDLKNQKQSYFSMLKNCLL